MGSHHLIEALVEEGDWPADTRRLICPHCNEEVVILGCLDPNLATCTDPACPVCHGSGWYYPEIGDECRACGTDLVPDPRFIEQEGDDDAN